MSKSVTLYNVFVASPNDVQTERDSLKEIIKEINLTTGTILGIKLELVNWESNVYPDFGSDAQDVINNQINDDYDIFIGIMWSKFGTPTNRSDSGTKEEFLRAYKRWKGNQQAIKLMFYFKNAPIHIDNINLEQIQFIRDFKHELGEKGGLYFPFDDVEQFKQLVRVHLSKALYDLVNSNNSTTEIEIIDKNTITKKEEDVEELGLYENLEISEKMFLDTWVPINNMTQYLTDLTSKLNDKTEAINKLVTVPDNVKIRESKRLIDQTAEDMLDYVNRTNVEIPIFKNLYKKGFNAFLDAYTIWKSIDSESEQLKNSMQSILGLKEGLTVGIRGMTSFMQSIQSIPAMTTALNKAKKKTVETVNNLIKEFEFALELIEEFEQISN